MAIGNLQEILLTMQQNKLRTALTAFGVFWGVFMFVLLLGAGKGLENGARANITNDDLSSIWVHSRKTSLPYQGLAINRKIEFNNSDLAAIERQLPGLKVLSTRSSRNAVTISRKNKTASFTVNGVGDDFFRIRLFIEQRSGRKLHNLDNWQSKKVAIIGTRVKEAIFLPHENPIGEYISLNGVMMKVVGVFYDDGNRGRGSERLYIPATTFNNIFAQNFKVGNIIVVPKIDVDAFELEEKLVNILKERHRVSPEDSRAISANNVAKYTKDITDLFSAISAFIWFVGIGTLTAGIVGISNIMIITVKDRTREIGIRKALGATPWSIVNMILSESILLTALAGYLGLVSGVALLEASAHLFASIGGEVQKTFQNPEVDMAVAMQVLMLLIFSGALAGFAPALHAAKITPIAAMREEK